jgi:hypothetical protein
VPAVRIARLAFKIRSRLRCTLLIATSPSISIRHPQHHAQASASWTKTSSTAAQTSRSARGSGVLQGHHTRDPAGVINGLIIAFTLSVDDFRHQRTSRPGSKVQTLSMTIYAMTRKRISPKINAVSTLLFVFVLILLLIINIREARQEKQVRIRLSAHN